MAHVVYWPFIFIYVVFLQLHMAAQESNKDDKIENVTIPEGTKRFHLRCVKGVNVTWKKDDKIIYLPRNEKFKLTGMSPDELPLLCVKKTNKFEGNYTCHASKSSPPLKQINVQVMGKIDMCGKVMKGQIIERPMCPSITDELYPCCKTIPSNAAKNMKVKTLNSLNSENLCSIYNSAENYSNPWQLRVSWEKRKTGTFGAWGWMLRISGLGGAAGYSHCVEMHDLKIRNWTISALVLGASYNITLQTLLQSVSEPNSQSKIVKIPSLQEMCQTVGRNCNWEICSPVENLTVTNFSSFPVVSWNSPPFFKSRHAFEVIYYDEHNSDKGGELVVEREFLKLTLKSTYRTKYYVEDFNAKRGYSRANQYTLFLYDNKNMPGIKISKYESLKVIPRFRGRSGGPGSIVGTRSKLMFYSGGEPRVITPVTTPVTTKGSASTLKIIIPVCVSVVCLCILIIAVYSCIIFRRKGTQTQLMDDTPRTSVSEGPRTNVLLVHCGHCESCNNVTHILANVLMETGYIYCFLDLCSTQDLGKKGLKWYQEKFKSSEKVVIICTKESKKMEEHDYDKSSNISSCQSSLCFLHHIMRGQIANNNNGTQLVPVYFDYSSMDDIPDFLSDRQCYSLPSAIDQLISSLSGIHARRIGDMAEYRIEYTNELERKVSQLRSAISRVEREHGCSRTGLQLVNYARSLSSSSTDHNYRI